jgi:glucose-6-phosphate-specific signal transduction histidine kinase
MSGALLGLASLAAVVATLVFWFRGIQQVALRGRRGQVLGVMIGAFGAALIALTWHPGWLGGLLSSIFLALAGLSRQERRHPTVGVGDLMLEFEAIDAEGRPWSSASRAGRPYLLKFFRGHW